MLAAATLLLALLAGDGAIRPLPAESAASFQCRARFQPQARRCANLCRTTLADEGAAFECVAGCTTRALDELAACRRAPGVPAATSTPAAALAIR